MKKLLKNLIPMILSLLFTFIGVEIFMRVGFDLLPTKVQGDLQSVRRVPWDDEVMVQAVPIENSRTYQATLATDLKDFPVRWHDAQFTFTTRPLWDGHWVGLRNAGDPEWPLDIVAFGDSFTFCWTALEDCWVQNLRQDYGWHIINAGQPGTGSGGQVTLMRELADPLDEKLIIWQWYTNDIPDDFVLDWLNERTPWLEWPPAPPNLNEAKGLAQYSAIYRLIDTNILHRPSADKYQHYQVAKDVNGRDLRVISGEYSAPFTFDYNSTEYGWEKHVQYRTEGAQLAQELGIPMVMLFIPTKEEAYAEILVEEDILDQEYLDKIGESRRRMLELCAEQDWLCVDATPALQQAIRDGKNVYYINDFHLNPDGNKVIEQLVADFIIEHNLLADNSAQ